MKTLYLECNMGAAGDMLAAALLELCPDQEAFLARLDRLGIPSVKFQAQPAVRCGITGTRLTVAIDGKEEESLDGEHCHHSHESEHDHEHDHDHAHGHEHGHEHEHEHEHGHHAHATMAEIGHLLSHLELPEEVRRDAEAVYGLIADAESKAHGRPVEQIHFHEVGELDAVADIVSVCLLIHELAPERILCSPVHVGSGRVRCAHGVLPVPAPATAHILKDVPVYGGTVEGELCTPTGAALLKQFADGFGSLPPMKIEKIGYGMGKKEFAEANCVRALLGETEQTEAESDTVWELCCNLDDMTPEACGFAMDTLLEAGALDVYFTPIQMKKNRPAVLLSCLCRAEDKAKMTKLLFRHTTTLGVRERLWERQILRRSQRIVETSCGTVRVKEARGFGVCRKKAEFEDLARIAAENQISLREAAELAAQAEDGCKTPNGTEKQ